MEKSLEYVVIILVC